MKNNVQKILCASIVHRFITAVGLFFLICPFANTFAQEDYPASEKELPLEKVYLHIDRGFYTAGEDIWFKAYLMDARDHTPNTLSEIIYIELIDPNGKVIAQRILKTKKASAAGDFKIPVKSTMGTYTIRAYTNYMRNFGSQTFFTKEIIVNTANSPTIESDADIDNPYKKVDIQFFPEGGYIINGFLNPIAFKALDKNGESIEINGSLVDDLGNEVTRFTTSHLGMGLFHFIPKANRKYHAILAHSGKEQRFEMHKSFPSGVLMTISNQEDFYKIELRATKDLKIKDYLLMGKQGGTVRFNLAVNANKQENSTIVKVVKNILDEGILELTLVNQKNKPIAERLLFHEKGTGIPNVKITSLKNAYEKREPVVMEIALNAPELDKITADMSLSVSNVAVNGVESYVTNIKTYLLLNSAVRGKIERPGYYFYSSDPKREQYLDLLMRTQGWRQYALEEELVASSNYFLPEKGLTLSGQVVNASNNEQPLTGSVSLTSNSASEMLQDKVETSGDGTFSFANLNFTDTTNVLLSANVYYPKKKRNPTLNYKILLDSVVSPPLLSIRSVVDSTSIVNSSRFKTMENFTTSYQKAQQTSQSFEYNNKTIRLEEAFVDAKKKPKALDKFERKRQGMPYREPSQTIDFVDIDVVPGQNALFALQGRVPGLSYVNGGVNLRGRTSFSGTSKALILLNGIPVDNTGGAANSNEIISLDAILPITGDEVDFIDIIKGPRAAIYGARAANGVIAIYTKNGMESSGINTKAGGSLNFEHPGFYPARKFYTPKYNSNQEVSKDLDIRTTLHWEPYIELNPAGKSTISFYTGDISGAYQVVLEGISSLGTPIYQTATFNVN